MPAVRLRYAASCLLVVFLGATAADAGQEISTAAADGNPIAASISRPVSSTRDLPSISFSAAQIQRNGRPVDYVARFTASVDSGAFAPIAEIWSGKSGGGRIDVMLGSAATRPGFHAIRVKVEFSDGSPLSSSTLPLLFYAIYDPTADSDASVRALVYGPASTPAKDLDAQLGDEPFAAWLSGVLSARRASGDSAPEWVSDYCDNRTADPTRKTPPTAVCCVLYFASRDEIGELWFRTADINESEQGVSWAPLMPAKFEGMILDHVPETRGLSALPSILDTPRQLRAAGDISVLPGDIVVSPAAQAGAPFDVAITVRNIGLQDLHKVTVNVAWGVDDKSRPATRQFIVDVPQQGAAEIKLQVAFPNGYGFIMAHAMPLGEHSPFGTWTPDPTPDDDCAFRIVNAQLAPSRYRETLLEASASGCTGK